MYYVTKHESTKTGLLAMGSPFSDDLHIQQISVEMLVTFGEMWDLDCEILRDSQENHHRPTSSNITTNSS